MSDTVTIPSHVIVTVRRPNGDIETVNYTEKVPQVRAMTKRTLDTINNAMREANRGEIIAYENITVDVEAPKPSAADLAEEEYIRNTNAIYRMAAGGEPCDQINSVADGDNTPAHKSDY